MATLMYKTFNGLARSLEEDFEIKNNERYYFCNNEKIIKLAKPTTNFIKKSLSYYGARVWNNLPLYFKKTNSLQSFKYNVSEFVDPNLNILDNF